MLPGTCLAPCFTARVTMAQKGQEIISIRMARSKFPNGEPAWWQEVQFNGVTTASSRQVVATKPQERQAFIQLQQPTLDQ